MGNNPFKIEIELKQYTPLLHFQGDQEGACLRATEVKPALDRFVCRLIREQGQDIPEEWKIKTEDSARHIALRYKMRIQANGEMTRLANTARKERNREGKTVLKPDRPSPNKNNIHPLYFGAMGEENFNRDTLESKISGVSYDSHTLTILCTTKETIKLDGKEESLKELLERVLPVFFALHCFGTRSNKGFGSFYVAQDENAPGKENEITPDVVAAYLPKTVPALYYVSYPRLNDAWTILDDVQTLSMLMKSGYNYTHGKPGDPRYYKGMIIQYFLDAGIHSDKAAIKADVLPCPKEDTSVKTRFGFRADQKSKDCKYVRGVLGITQTYEYRADRENPNSMRAGVVEIEGALKDSNGKPLIARYENPIHFKPHGKYLFLIPQEIPNAIPDAEFEFSGKGTGNLTKLRIPDSATGGPGGTTYSLDNFLQYVQKKYRTELADSKSNLSRMLRETEPKPVRAISNSLKRIKEIERANNPKGGEN